MCMKQQMTWLSHKKLLDLKFLHDSKKYIAAAECTHKMSLLITKHLQIVLSFNKHHKI